MLAIEELAARLRSLGDLQGRAVMVHASMRKLGAVEHRAEGVIRATLSAIGPEGTMLMMLAAADDEEFDQHTTPAALDNGVLAEVFRTFDGVSVNDNPACRFGAIGPLAATLLEPQPLHHYYGPGSPLERLYEHGGYVLRLGSDIDTVTLTHYAEYRADVAPKTMVRRHYVRADSGELWIDSLDDSDGIFQWAHGDYFAQIMRDYLDEGRASVGRVGDCAAELLEARSFVDFATRWIEEHFDER